jgi:hypothetical protein
VWAGCLADWERQAGGLQTCPEFCNFGATPAQPGIGMENRPIKIFNDPVHGFIEVPKGLLVELIDHPWVQRLRRIRQMGLASLVYASAVHSRF